VAAGVLTNRRGQVLLCRRPAGGRFGLRWELPGGKVERGETSRAALVRELREELRIEARPGARLLALAHRYRGGPRVRLEFFRVSSYRGRVRNLAFHEMRWVSPRRLERYDVLEADVPLIRLLATGTLRAAVAVARRS
jgi:8-oxo-dGTP diphosphatase